MISGDDKATCGWKGSHHRDGLDCLGENKDEGENKVNDLELIKLQVDPLRIYSLFQNLISIGPKNSL